MNEYTFTGSKIRLKQEAKAAKFAYRMEVDDSSQARGTDWSQTTSRRPVRAEEIPGLNPDLYTQFAGRRSFTNPRPSSIALGSTAQRFERNTTEHRLEAYATLTPSRRHSRCTAIALWWTPGDRSTVRKANVA
jgi:hypothetical protein